MASINDHMMKKDEKLMKKIHFFLFLIYKKIITNKCRICLLTSTTRLSTTINYTHDLRGNAFKLLEMCHFGCEVCPTYLT